MASHVSRFVHTDFLIPESLTDMGTANTASSTVSVKRIEFDGDDDSSFVTPSSLSDASSFVFVHDFELDHFDGTVHFQWLAVKGTSFLWIGSDRGEFESLMVSLQIEKFGSVAQASSLFGCEINDLGETMSRLLAKRTGLMIFVSYNLNPNAPGLFEEVTARLIKELNDRPELVRPRDGGIF
eukprot:TRINITY_DN7033_c0_g1_i1.p1 TRINITY_DN7033_c0_g1~~TRINITY_DN7033_c0_g1_i1.p1  ORF type:complete len:182 (+),score=30.46 TRINITY_DN7033_c0_g1_i1:141-686(+)